VTFVIRELHDPDDVVAVEDLQLAAWGRNEREVVPRGILIAIRLQGGLLAGSFEDDVMTGFVLGFPTADPTVQHSHMLAVHPAHRRSGAALALKAYQREWCLARGVTRVQWTFDPLRGLNANFNLRKLGATISRYHANLYGEMSGINAGVASDRALADWNLTSDRVAGALSGSLAEPDWASAEAINATGPDAWRSDLTASRLRFCIPDDFGALLQSDLERARTWRQHGREVLTHYFERGYSVTGFGRQGGNAYLLTPRTPAP